MNTEAFPPFFFFCGAPQSSCYYYYYTTVLAFFFIARRVQAFTPSLTVSRFFFTSLDAIFHHLPPSTLTEIRTRGLLVRRLRGCQLHCPPRRPMFDNVNLLFYNIPGTLKRADSDLLIAYHVNILQRRKHIKTLLDE